MITSYICQFLFIHVIDIFSQVMIEKYYEVSKICSCGKDEHWVDVDGKIVVVFDHKHRSLSQVFVVWDMSAMKVLFKAYCCV